MTTVNPGFYRLYRIARADFSYFFRTKWLMAVLVSLSLSDMLVMGFIYGRIITSPLVENYFHFLIPGIVVVGLFSAATDTGRRIWLGLREGVIQYYMVLPIRTTGLVAAYIISGGLTGIVFSGILLGLAFVLVPTQNILNALIVLPFMFVLSTGIAGLAAFFASISRQGEIYWVYAQALQVLLVTISTVFYPLETIQHYLPGPVATIAEYNPLSQAASLLRTFAFGSAGLDVGLLGMLLLTSLPLASLGAVAYWFILRTIRLRGKP
jgi:ABC-type polysaccharide/polyol phosphate export permease